MQTWSISTILLASAFSLGTATTSSAADCDAALRKDSEQFSHKIVSFLSYTNNFTKNATEDDKKVAEFTYSGVRITYADVHSITDYISQQNDYSVSYNESVSILRSFLSANGLAAYKACLNQNEPVVISYADDAISDDSFFIHVHWNPD